MARRGLEERRRSEYQEETMSSVLAVEAPNSRPIYGHLPEFRRDSLDFLTQLARDHGEFVRFRLGPQRAVLLNSPELIGQVLAETNRHYTRHFLPRLSGSLLGLGLFTSEGRLWSHERRLIQPAFHREHAKQWCSVMTESAERAVAQWGDGEVRDTHNDMVAVALENVSRTLFGADVHTDIEIVARALQVVMDNFESRLEMLVPPPHWVPTPANLRLAKVIRQLDDILYRFVNDRRTSGQARGDVLDVLLEAQARDSSIMSDQQIRDEAMALFTGGHEPVAAGLSWAWYLISEHPEVEARLLDELDTVLAGRTPDAGDLPALQYLSMVVKETFRLYPPSWGFDRKATVDCHLGGHHIRRGTLVIISQWVLHRDERFFEKPDQFIPERWAGSLAETLPKYAYIPFGGGPRYCIGNSFATIETILVLATILQRARLRLAPGRIVVPQPTITLRPKHGLEMVVEKR
jgi:cytochrome P450